MWSLLHLDDNFTDFEIVPDILQCDKNNCIGEIVKSSIRDDNFFLFKFNTILGASVQLLCQNPSHDLMFNLCDLVLPVLILVRVCMLLRV